MNRPMRCYTKKKIHTNYVTLQKFREARWPPVCWTPDGTVWVLLTLFSTQTLLPPESKQRLLKSMQFGQDPLAIAPLCSTLERLWHAAFYHKKTMFPLTWANSGFSSVFFRHNLHEYFQFFSRIRLCIEEDNFRELKRFILENQPLWQNGTLVYFTTSTLLS